MRVNRGAVLWLPYVAQHAIENLQKQCLHYGIHRSRLVFSNQSSEAASDARGETRFQDFQARLTALICPRAAEKWWFFPQGAAACPSRSPISHSTPCSSHRIATRPLTRSPTASRSSRYRVIVPQGVTSIPPSHLLSSVTQVHPMQSPQIFPHFLSFFPLGGLGLQKSP